MRWFDDDYCFSSDTFRRDFEDQPELLTLIDQLFGQYDQQFTLYKQKILTPTIEKVLGIILFSFLFLFLTF
jgi:hypothetical protein